ncbi:ankyrin repeat domain-containing protein 28 [Colletotrichum tofieldiae]|uniref:Ankyrin repeat domain-containing protein 28 n=1 Tax=Colletotrichum tofieldiae TaxID=708197 RepID=A0A166XUP1_9PEZI|nr:ankyrin repeat domain-containing protein 28 [Colletotrichum tofieldiae]
MCHPSAVRLCLLLLACVVGTAQADGWDDFANNLATDLAPLLALFGEQVTKQFLSESTTRWDNFIFAMAPLGVITAVVSAIRVCGGPSLRAFIGRAQEGGGIAEAELCSSTSRDVCELYHNGAIVRVFGRPKILEIVHDREAANEEFSGDHQTLSKCGIYPFREYIETPSAKKARWGEIGKEARDDTEAQNRASDDNTDVDNFAPNPNLSFNIGIRKPPGYKPWLAAAIAFLAQASVLVFGGLVTTWGWKKEQDIPPAWAFPLMSLGTVLLCGGMFYCAFLVENSTKERVFRKSNGESNKDDDDNNAKQSSSSPASTIYVVQPGNQIIGDQTFDSFLFDDSSTPINQYITSWKTPQQSDDERGVWLATVITMSGFVLQFVGLRAMHSAVSVLQLGAILVVSIIRAGMRTQRLKKEDNLLHNRPDEVEGHELDWLALHMGKDEKDKNKCFSWVVSGAAAVSHSVDSHEDNKEGDYYGSIDGPSKKTSNFGSQESGQIDKETKKAPGSRRERDLAIRTFHYRSRLAELTSQSRLIKSRASTGWDDRLVPVRQLAQQLKNAIESSAKILFPTEHDWGAKPLPWIIQAAECSYSASCPSIKRVPIRIPLQRNSESPTKWNVNQRHLEAAIGLWTWSIISNPRMEKDDKFKFKVSEASEVPASRIMAVGTTPDELERAKTDMQFWTDDFPSLTAKTLTVTKDRMGTGPDIVWETKEDGSICSASGTQSSSAPRPKQSLLRLFGWQFATLPTLDGSSTKAFALTTALSHSISTACAQDIYQSFLCATTEVLGSIGGQTKYSKGSRGFCLVNEVVSGLVECFKESSLGSTQDAFSVILPALRYRHKLPSAADALPDVYSEAEDLRKKGRFQEAEDVLKWAWETASKIGDGKESHALEATMLELGELYRNALFWKEGPKEEFSRRGINWMRDQAPNKSLADISNRYLKFEGMEADKSIPATAQDLFAALSKGDRTETLWLISRVTELLSRDENGRTVLSWASQHDWPEIVKAAMDIGSAIDSEDDSGRTPLSYAAEYGHANIVRILMKSQGLPIAPDSFRRTPLSHAAAGGHVPVMRVLLDDPRVTPHDSDKRGYSALHWAAENGHEDAIGLLLDRKAPIDAVNDNEHTPLVVALLRRQTRAAMLLAKRKANYNIEIEGFEAWRWAIKNGEWACAGFLLNCSNKEGQKGTPSLMGRRAVILGVFPKFPRYRADLRDLGAKSDNVVTAYVFDEGGRQVPITTDSIRRSFGRPYTVKAWLCEQIDGDMTIEGLYFDKEKSCKIAYLLSDHLGEEFKITEDIVKVAVYDKHSREEVTRLLHGGKTKIEITNGLVEEIAGKFEGDSIRALLDRGGEEVKITEDVVKAAVKNTIYGEEVTKLLLDQRGDEVKITEGVIKAAVENMYSGQGVTKLLLDRRGEEVNITEDIVKVAGKNKPSGDEVMRLLYSGKKKIEITNGLVEAVAGNFEGDSIRVLLDQGGEEVKITEDVVKAAAGNDRSGAEVLRLLLDERGDEVKITEDIVKAAAGNNGSGAEVLRLLLKQRGDEVKVTEDVVKAAAGNDRSGAEVLRLLLDERGDEVKITEAVVKAAVENESCAEEVTKLLLDRRGEEVKITEDIIKSAATNYWCGEKLTRLLLDRRGEEVNITEDIIELAATNDWRGKEVTKLLLDRRRSQGHRRRHQGGFRG